MKNAKPVIIKGKTEFRPKVRQYPLKPDVEKGIEPIIKDLKAKGIIKVCPESECNTLIFPVRKAAPSLDWRMVQDLRAVNNAVEVRAPNVPNPHTLSNTLKPEPKYFSVVDLKNAFWSIPVEEKSQEWFAFTFKGQRLMFTRLAQGFVNSPTIFTEAITTFLHDFEPPKGSQILIYVDDLLVASETQEQCKKDMLALLQFLYETGNKVSKNKLQLWKGEVKYLGHVLTETGRVIDQVRKQTIKSAHKPQTKKQMMSFLGLCNYCRLWVPGYSQKVQPLQDLVHGTPKAMNDKLIWNAQAEEALVKIKQALTDTSVLTILNRSPRWWTVKMDL